LKNGQGGGT